MTVSYIKIHKVTHTAGTARPAKSKVLKEQAPRLLHASADEPRACSGRGKKGAVSSWKPRRANGKHRGDWLSFPSQNLPGVGVWPGWKPSQETQATQTAAGTCSPNPVSSSGFSCLETPLGCSLRTRLQGLRRKRELGGYAVSGGVPLLGTEPSSCRALRGCMCHQGRPHTARASTHMLLYITVLSRTCY